jgi:hypothetical protein
MQKATLSKRGSGLHAQFEKFKKFKKKIRNDEQELQQGRREPPKTTCGSSASSATARNTMREYRPERKR